MFKFKQENRGTCVYWKTPLILNSDVFLKNRILHLNSCHYRSIESWKDLLVINKILETWLNIRKISFIRLFHYKVIKDQNGNLTFGARRGGAEVAGWTSDRKIRVWFPRKIRVRFPAYPHRVWALWWQGGKRRLRTSRCPCRGKLGWVELSWIGFLTSQLMILQSHMWRHIDVQADWRRSLTYGRAPNTIDIS